MIDDFEDQLDKIRVDLFEKTKDMTNSEAVDSINEKARKIASQYGISITKGAVYSVE